ncbi:retrovirus-related pol polyprotein from transposon TNT 1-94 [Tanacetum coccineum]
MLCYLAGMEPYYIKCIKDGLFQPKTAEDGIMESVISCETAKATWTDLGLRNANHTQTLDLANIYGRFVYEDNLIQRRYSDTKKALITTPSSTAISTAFFSNNVVQDFQENSDDDVDERSSHFAKDCLSKTSEPSYKSPVTGYSSVSKVFQPKFFPKLIQSSQSSSSQADPKVQKDYKAEYKKMKAKLALLEASPSTSQNPKAFQPKNKCLIAETFDWDEEEVLDDEEVTQVKVIMPISDDEILWGTENQCLAMCRDELLVLKQAKLEAVTFQIQYTELTKLNHTLQEQLKEERKINEKWLTSSKKVSQCISEQILSQKKKILRGELLTESSSKKDVNENLFIPASMVYDHEMVSKSKDWVERHNLDNKLLNFNTERILVPESQAVNECLKPTEALNDPESSKDFESDALTPLPPLKNLQGASPSSKSVSETVTVSDTEPTTSSFPIEVKNTEQESKIIILTKLVQMLINEKAQPYQYASPSKQILKAKAKPFPPCTHYGFNDHIPYDYRNYPEYEICRSYDHFTSGHNRVIHIRGGVLVESSQSSKSSIGVKCNTCGSTIHSTIDHNEFDHFKRETHQEAHLVPGQWMLKEMVENQNDVKVKQIRTDNGTEFKNSELESFYDEKGISQNLSSPYTPEQNGVAKRKNITLIEAARTMLNGSDHLSRFDAKADDEYFLGYSFNSKAFRVFKTRRQQIEETYHVTFDESMEAIRFTNTLVDEIGIDNSSRYPHDEYHHKDDPSRQYQSNSDISYYIIPHGRSLTELAQEKYVPELIAPNEPDIPYT